MMIVIVFPSSKLLGYCQSSALRTQLNELNYSLPASQDRPGCLESHHPTKAEAHRPQEYPTTEKNLCPKLKNASRVADI